jgi:hypothetical protein
MLGLPAQSMYIRLLFTDTCLTKVRRYNEGRHEDRRQICCVDLLSRRRSCPMHQSLSYNNSNMLYVESHNGTCNARLAHS